MDNRAVAALLISTAGGAVVIFVWAEVLHWVLRRQFPGQFSHDDRLRWTAIVIGILERGLLTTFIIWLQPAAGPFTGAWIAVKAVIGWGERDGTTIHGRARYIVSLMNSMASMFWAVSWGILGMPA